MKYTLLSSTTWTHILVSFTELTIIHELLQQLLSFPALLLSGCLSCNSVQMFSRWTIATSMNGQGVSSFLDSFTGGNERYCVYLTVKANCLYCPNEILSHTNNGFYGEKKDIPDRHSDYNWRKPGNNVTIAKLNCV